MAFVPSKLVHEHGAQDVMSEFMESSCFAPAHTMPDFFNFKSSKGN